MASFRANAQPTISSFAPTSGPIGTTVTITGTNFNITAANNIVFFGATQAAVTAASSSSLTVTVPAGATYQYISVLDLVSNLTAYSTQPFIVTFPCGGVINTSTFAPKVDFPAGYSGHNVVSGDLDGDGKSDLIFIREQNQNIVSVLRNISTSGNISFAAKVDFATGAWPERVAISDLDGDGKQELVVLNRVANTVSVFKNTCVNGTISFASKIDFATGDSPQGVTIGDFDADGKPDLAIANTIDNTVSSIKNTSTGGTLSFAPKMYAEFGVKQRIIQSHFIHPRNLDVLMAPIKSKGQ